jgi:hypothetical protein
VPTVDGDDLTCGFEQRTVVGFGLGLPVGASGGPAHVRIILIAEHFAPV